MGAQTQPGKPYTWHRVRALLLLCDLRLDREDMRNALEVCQKPLSKLAQAAASKQAAASAPRTTRGAVRGVTPIGPGGSHSAAPGRLLGPEAMRKTPLGVDASGCALWLLEMGHCMGELHSPAACRAWSCAGWLAPCEDGC